jgi:tRNA-specific 2-thiouridylase
LCFIGKVKLPVFLQQQLQPKEGLIVEIDANHPVFNGRLEPQFGYPTYTHEMGKVVGKHRGAHYYTIGQRKGLMVGGKEEPLFVIATDVTTNTVYVGQSDMHPGLLRSGLRIEAKNVHWIRPDAEPAVGVSMRTTARIRYRQPLEPCNLMVTQDGIEIVFDTPQRAIAEGQFVAWYTEGELLGSAVM